MELIDFTGIATGLATFAIIGLFHPIVIKAEYYLGKGCWWLFLAGGIAFAVLSAVIGDRSLIWSTVSGVVAFSSFWSILELFHQEKRVRKGWFPENPARRPEYDFDELIPRRGTNSYKWDNAPDGVLPLWVADMDFRTARPVIQALQKRVGHGIFGYTKVPEEYYDAVTGWFGRRHGLHIEKDWIIYTSGVVPAISAIIKAMTVPGDKVLVQTPVYNCFFSSIRNNGCEVVTSPLVRTADSYAADFEDFEAKASDPSVKVFILCNPHNPAGRVWTETELRRMGEICLRHNVFVIADEIHCELVYKGCRYIPFASLSDDFLKHSATCLSPSKAFNIAGLQIANIVVSDTETRAGIDKAINVNEVCDVNPFGVIATIAAYNEGEEWLDQLLDYLAGNYGFMKEYCGKYLSDFPLVRLEGTYLVWMDCSMLGMPSGKLEEELMEKAGLWLNAGTMYGAEGEGYMRWNIACPRSRLEEALGRFREYVRTCRRSL